MRPFMCLPLVALLALVPAPVSAVTVDQVIELAHAGVTDAIILALIDRDKTIFTIDPEQIVALQRDGLSESVIVAMLKSGREEGEEAARADAASKAAWIIASMNAAPELVIVGRGPDRPNAAQDGFNPGPPVLVPSFMPSFRRSATPPYGARRFDTPRQLCFAQVTVARPGATLLPAFVTECPAVMQPGRKR
jgi:hypothetical protein